MSQFGGLGEPAAEEVERLEITLAVRYVTELEELAASNAVSVEGVAAMLVQGALGLVLERRMKGRGCRRCGLRLRGSALCVFCRLEISGRRVPFYPRAA